MQSAQRISLAKVWRLNNSYLVRNYVLPSTRLLKDDNSNDSNCTPNDIQNAAVNKISKQNELIRILNQTAKDKNLIIKGSVDNTTGGNGNQGPAEPITTNGPSTTSGSGLGSGSGSGKMFHCPKCGAVCTNVESLVSLSR